VLASDSPPDTLINAYGPTESTTFASWYPITQVPDGALRLPIGLPICNTTLHVLDRHRRLVPPGVPGELFIGGDGLALGYVNDPELTCRKFVPDPFAAPPARVYASGDLVVREASGEVVFLRRLDDQLKIRGFRVEPVEIEAALRAIDGVSGAVVVPWTVEGYPRLVAYVLVDSPGVEPNAIRAQLRADLPDYLVPSRVVIVQELPLTKSGKLDRANLPDPFSAASEPDDEPPPVRTDDVDDRLAGSIADIWRDVLGVRVVDPDEGFFDAGGDSLLAVRLYGAVRRRFGVVLPSGIIDQDFTIGKFIEAVQDALRRAAPPMLTEMTTVDGPVIVLVAPGGGELDDYRWLVPALDGRFRIVGLREPGHYGTEPRPRSMAGVAAACSQALREAAIESPVAIIGECIGGAVAHQLACDLSRAGHAPDLVVLLDAPVPGENDADATGANWSDLVTTVRRRGRNAVALTKMQTRWTWYRVRHLPSPPALAHSMTLRNNVRRIREAQPSFFAGRVLYVQAVDGDGMMETDGGPEYWSGRVGSLTLVTAPGSHAGTESFLSRSNAGITAEAIVRELNAARETAVE
jgi:thioesterase domain-containing protein/acyl carrier protein